MSIQHEPQDAFLYRPVGLHELELAARGPLTRFQYLLAVKFNYDVNQGGFSQLLYNMQGNYLSEIEDMLLATKAAVAQDYYIRAVRICLENKETYFAFLSSDYTEPNEVKHSLQLLSVDYLQRRNDFANEAADFLAGGRKL